MWFTEQIMKIKLKITIITLGLTLANLNVDSVLSQETLPCYMINPAGETVNLLDLCTQESSIGGTQTNIPTSVREEESTNQTTMIPLTETGETGQTEPVTDNIDFDNDAVNPLSFEENLRGLRRSQETLDLTK